MDLLNIIAKRRCTRKFTSRDISDKLLEKIIRAGLFGPSIHCFQPWRFVVVRKRKLLKKIVKMVVNKFYSDDIPAFITRPSILPLTSASVLILVYNSSDLTEAVKRLRYKIFKKVKIAEISAIAASVQNMVLAADALGIGSCWLDSPLFYKKEISALVSEEGDLVATLAFGYSAKKGKRSQRKPIKKALKVIG